MTVQERFDQHVEESWRKIEDDFTEKEREFFHRVFLIGTKVGAVCASTAIIETLDASEKLWGRRRTVQQIAKCHLELTHAIEEDARRSKKDDTKTDDKGKT